MSKKQNKKSIKPMIFGFPSIITSSTSQDPELMNLGVLYKMVLLRVRGLSAGSL